MLATTPTVPIAAHLIRYVSLIIEATHPEGESAPASVRKYVRWGASPRGGQAMVLAAKATALLEGRPHVTAEGAAEHLMAKAHAQHGPVAGREITDQVSEGKRPAGELTRRRGRSGDDHRGILIGMDGP